MKLKDGAAPNQDLKPPRFNASQFAKPERESPGKWPFWGKGSQPELGSSEKKPTHDPFHFHQADYCPHCHSERAQKPSTIPGTFLGGLHRLVTAVMMIIGAVVRLARFSVAASLTAVGLVGTFCHAAASLISHPDDRRWLRLRPRLVWSRPDRDTSRTEIATGMVETKPRRQTSRVIRD